jgi:hypothetical protein
MLYVPGVSVKATVAPKDVLVVAPLGTLAFTGMAAVVAELSRSKVTRAAVSTSVAAEPVRTVTDALTVAPDLDPHTAFVP